MLVFLKQKIAKKEKLKYKGNYTKRVKIEIVLNLEKCFVGCLKMGCKLKYLSRFGIMGADHNRLFQNNGC